MLPGYSKRIEAPLGVPCFTALPVPHPAAPLKLSLPVPEKVTPRLRKPHPAVR